MNNPSLVLTATIDVTVNKTVKIKNSNERLEQYIKSLKKWLTKQNIFKRIVFVENSGHNLNELRELVINIKMIVWNQSFQLPSDTYAILLLKPFL